MQIFILYICRETERPLLTEIWVCIQEKMISLFLVRSLPGIIKPGLAPTLENVDRFEVPRMDYLLRVPWPWRIGSSSGPLISADLWASSGTELRVFTESQLINSDFLKTCLQTKPSVLTIHVITIISPPEFRIPHSVRWNLHLLCLGLISLELTRSTRISFSTGYIRTQRDTRAQFSSNPNHQFL